MSHHPTPPLPFHLFSSSSPAKTRFPKPHPQPCPATIWQFQAAGVRVRRVWAKPLVLSFSRCAPSPGEEPAGRAWLDWAAGGGLGQRGLEEGLASRLRKPPAFRVDPWPSRPPGSGKPPAHTRAEATVPVSTEPEASTSPHLLGCAVPQGTTEVAIRDVARRHHESQHGALHPGNVALLGFGAHAASWRPGLESPTSMWDGLG